MPLQMFVVERRSCGRHASGRFLLEPDLGVMAFASAYTESTALTNVAADLSDEVLYYLELGFPRSIANTPALARFEEPPAGRFTAARLVASLRLANERFAQGNAGNGLVSVSAVALHAERRKARVVAAGACGDVWHIHNGRVSWIRRRRGVELRGIGADDTMVPDVSDVELTAGDLMGMGYVDESQVEFVAAHADRLDEALAGLLRRSTRLGLALVARWAD